MADRFDDKAREILRAIDADLRALMEPAMTLREGIIVRRLLSAVELRGGSDATARHVCYGEGCDAMVDTGHALCVACQSRRDAPASEPAAPRAWSDEEVEACARAGCNAVDDARGDAHSFDWCADRLEIVEDAGRVLRGESVYGWRAGDGATFSRAVLSHAATLRPPAAVPQCSHKDCKDAVGHGPNCCDCGAYMKPAAVPASPQATARGDLLERMAGALNEAIDMRVAMGRPVPVKWTVLLAEYAAEKKQ